MKSNTETAIKPVEFKVHRAPKTARQYERAGDILQWLRVIEKHGDRIVFSYFDKQRNLIDVTYAEFAELLDDHRSELILDPAKENLAAGRDDGSCFEIKVDENVVSEYVNPTNFICDTDKVETWENCSWFAIRQYMTFDEVIAEFGEDFRDLLFDYSVKNTKSIEVYEVWDKKSSSVMYLTKALPHTFLKVISKGNFSDNFFPIAKPLLATMTNLPPAVI